MKRLHPPHEHGSEQAKKPLVLSLCRHGVSDSWATKQLIEDRLEAVAKKFRILARGVDPTGEKQVGDDIRGIEVTIDEIKRASLLLIHDSNLHYLRKRFGQELLSALESEGYLYVRNGRESQHFERNTDHPHRFIADSCRIFADLLQHSLRRRPAEEMVYDHAFSHAERADEKWHAEKNAKEDRHRRKHRKQAPLSRD